MTIVRYDVHESVGARTKAEANEVEQHFIAIKEITGYATVPREQLELSNIDLSARAKEQATHRLLSLLKEYCKTEEEIDTRNGDLSVRAYFHAPYIREEIIDQLEFDLCQEHALAGKYYAHWITAQTKYEQTELELTNALNQPIIKFIWSRLLKHVRKFRLLGRALQK